MATETRELPPGEGVGLDLSVNDGESILVIKRLRDGSYFVPAFLHAENMTHAEARDAVMAFCHGLLAKIREEGN